MAEGVEGGEGLKEFVLESMLLKVNA